MRYPNLKKGKFYPVGKKGLIFGILVTVTESNLSYCFDCALNKSQCWLFRPLCEQSKREDGKSVVFK